MLVVWSSDISANGSLWKNQLAHKPFLINATAIKLNEMGKHVGLKKK